MKRDIIGDVFLRWRSREASRFIDGRLLDVGCGTNYLVRTRGNGIGVDANPRPQVDRCCSAEALPFDDGSFDTVTMLACLNHITEREKALLEAHRVLNPRGRIVITMPPPFLSKLWHLFRGITHSWKHWQDTGEEEVFGLTVKEVVKLLTGAGFVPVTRRFFAFGMNRVIVGERLC